MGSIIKTGKTKNKNKKQKVKINNKKFKTRRDDVIDSIDESIKRLWFDNDKDKTKDFVNWLFEQEELDSDTALAQVDNSDKEYIELKKLREKPCKNFEEIITNIRKQNKIIKNNKKKKKIKGAIDTKIATMLRPNCSTKKYLDVSDYRKELKTIAKREEKELKEMERLGFKNKKAEKKMDKKSKETDGLTEKALKDSFSTKYPI